MEDERKRIRILEILDQGIKRENDIQERSRGAAIRYGVYSLIGAASCYFANRLQAKYGVCPNWARNGLAITTALSFIATVSNIFEFRASRKIEEALLDVEETT